MRSSKWEVDQLHNGYRYIAGVDEAGRGPLAGPVVAAAVIFPNFPLPFDVDDSKKLTPNQREKIFRLIKKHALAIGVGTVSHRVIDKINILQATYRAMNRAIHGLGIIPELVLVDGGEIPNLGIPQIAIKKGDSQCASIAAASIIAKVTRDRMMKKYDKKFPQYDFAQHKGYPTKAHIEAIRKHGFCAIHRRSFHIKNL